MINVRRIVLKSVISKKKETVHILLLNYFYIVKKRRKKSQFILSIFRKRNYENIMQTKVFQFMGPRKH